MSVHGVETNSKMCFVSHCVSDTLGQPSCSYVTQSFVVLVVAKGHLLTPSVLH